MRIRYKKWARGELEASPFYEDNPETFRGKWKEKFNNDNPIYLELGCGKGGFISQAATFYDDRNFIAVDMIDAMLGLAKRKVENEYNEKNKVIDNIIITRYNIENISKVFSKEDNIEGIYINFCNPWPRGKHNKRRLTHVRQLNQYREFLKDDGKIYFKTDSDLLFEASLEYFKEANFEIEKITYDLEKEEEFWQNFMTEHEKMFIDDGLKIKALIARKINNENNKDEE